jgi:hypothetical protein
MLCQLASDKIINDEKTLLNLCTMLLENEDRRMQVLYTSFNFLGWVLLCLHHVHKIINSMNALNYMLY